MKKEMKQKSILFLPGVLLCSTMVLWGCGQDVKVDETRSVSEENKEVTYQVTVKDALGNPYTSGVVVKFMKDGEQAAMQVCDENGVAAKELQAGDYTVSVSFTEGDESIYYDESNVSLSADNHELEVIVSHTITSDPAIIYYCQEEYDSYAVEVGCTYLDLTAGSRNYFLFTPTTAGTYAFSIADHSNAEIGYYGSPYYIFQESVAEVIDNTFTMSVSADMIGTEETGSTVIVIGVDAIDEQTDHCVLGIERIGDPEYNIADEPWVIYERTAELSEYKLPEGASVEEFDLTASSDEYQLVLNETDGFYHLDSEDGPLVLVHLTKDPGYVSCYKTILENADVNKYFFDENGEFVRRERYSDCLLEYIAYADPVSGLYPLTEDLKYIIMQSGDYAGWWDADGLNFMFVDPAGNKLNVNTDIAWLFMCCYISEN